MVSPSVAEGIGIAQFVFLVCIILLYPIFEGIFLFRCFSIIIDALEEGIVGRDGEGADVEHIVRFDADGILEVAFLVLTVDTDIVNVEYSVNSKKALGK